MFVKVTVWTPVNHQQVSSRSRIRTTSMKQTQQGPAIFELQLNRKWIKTSTLVDLKAGSYPASFLSVSFLHLKQHAVVCIRSDIFSSQDVLLNQILILVPLLHLLLQTELNGPTCLLVWSLTSPGMSWALLTSVRAMW